MGEQSGWQLSDNAPEAYERYIITAFLGEWAQDLVQTAALKAGERVLDLGCGTGAVARSAASVLGQTGRVVGIDTNESMLAMARRVLPPSGVAITWQHGDAAALPVPDADFDVVLCQQGLQYFAQRTSSLREMVRVLAPGGRLALSVWRPLERQPYFVALVAALEAYLNAEVAAPLRAAFTLGDMEELRGLVTTAGFRAPQIRLVVKQMRFHSLAEYLPGYLAASPMAGAIAAMEDARRTALFEDLLTELQPYIDDTGLAVPMECLVLVART
jgi:ubiquinone/menaquinone biosynthesis C-methylase UbiE